MIRNKKYFLLILVAIISIFMTACGANDNATGNLEESDSSEAAENGITEIRFAWWGDTGRHEVYNAIADLFEKENPDVKVIREPASWGDYWTRVSTQSAGGNAPAVLGMHPQVVSDYALRGVLADLEPFFADGTITTAEIPDSIIESGRVGENIYMISQGVTIQSIGTNRTLLERFGIDVPAGDEDWTWEDFMRLAREFAEATGSENLYFTSDNTSSWNAFRWMARQFGGDIFTDDGDLGFDEEALIRWFTMWNELRDIGAVPDSATTTEELQKPLEQQAFTLGNLALYNFPANLLALYQEQTDDQLDLIRLPRAADEVKRADYVEGAFFSISESASAAEQEAGARLIDFFINTEESVDIFRMEQGVPPNQRLSDHIKTGLEGSELITISFVDEMMQVAGAGVYPPLGAQEVETLFLNVGERVMHGMLTPEDAATTFMTEARSILDRN